MPPCLLPVFAVALSAVIGGSLYFSEDVSGPDPLKDPLAADSVVKNEEQGLDPFLQEYQELENLLQETREQREAKSKQLNPESMSQPVDEVAVLKKEAVTIAQEEIVESSPVESVIDSVEPIESVKQGSSVASMTEKSVVPQSEPPQQKMVETVHVDEKVSGSMETVESEKERILMEQSISKSELPVAKITERAVADVKPQKQAVTPVAPVAAKKRESKLGHNHVQVGAFTNKKRADAIVKDLGESSFKLQIVTVQQGSKTYYLLRDYSASDKKEALRLKKIYDEWLKVESLVRY